MAKREFAFGTALTRFTKGVRFSSIISTCQLKQRYTADIFTVFLVLIPNKYSLPLV